MSVAQVLDAGLSRRAIAHRVERGWLLRLHRGVYLVGPLEAPLSRCMAAALAVGSGAALSHAAAAWVWEIGPHPHGPVDVSVIRDVRSRPGIRVHRVVALPPTDLTRHRNLPITTPERTVHDLAATEPLRDVARAAEQAQIRELTTHGQLTASSPAPFVARCNQPSSPAPRPNGASSP